MVARKEEGLKNRSFVMVGKEQDIYIVLNKEGSTILVPVKGNGEKKLEQIKLGENATTINPIIPMNSALVETMFGAGKDLEEYITTASTP